MELNFNKIIRLKKIRIEKSELSEEENSLATPFLTDQHLIRDVYDLFVEIMNERGCPPCIESVHQRKKFIFIILFLYSPSTLAGGRVSNKIREELARVVSCHPSYISHNIENVLFEFQQYRDYRKDIDYLYTEIVNRLKVKGLIK